MLLMNKKNSNTLIAKLLQSLNNMIISEYEKNC